MGGAATLGGAGTMAGFTDVEEKMAELQAGELDLLIDYRSTYVPWERFELNADDPLRNSDYSDGEAIDVAGDDMTYVVGQSPDYRVDEDGSGSGEIDEPAVSSADWVELTTQTVDPCTYADATDLSGETWTTSAGTAVAIDGSPNTTDDTFEPGFINGFTGMQVDLTDVKPLDHGESTVSIHVCDNPSFVEYDFSYTDSQSVSDNDNGVNEPEEAAGDTGDNPWDMGELDDFLWVQVWQDANCNNQLDAGEVVLYEGSLANLIDQGTTQINPLQVVEIQSDGGSDSTNLPLAEDACVTVGGNPMCDNLHDVEVGGTTLADHGYEFSEHVSLEEDELPAVGDEMSVNGVTFLRTDDGCIEYETDGSVDICAVIMKGGGGPDLPPAAANVYVGETSTSLEGDLDSSTTGDQLCTPVPGNSSSPAAISRVDFCTCTANGGGDGELPPQEVPLCITDACIAYNWFLPQVASDTSTDPFGVGGQGFTDLPSDADIQDQDGDGEVTLADELIAKFGYPDAESIDVNVVQTDSISYKTEFVAEQCRHHLG